ncbi:MAG: hypothetical protein C4523_14160 [Myxococcales bacterium]|nr:MAG: hypothetical protein C4523_14160 [Myxococcales bacterium]
MNADNQSKIAKDLGVQNFKIGGRSEIEKKFAIQKVEGNLLSHPLTPYNCDREDCRYRESCVTRKGLQGDSSTGE